MWIIAPLTPGACRADREWHRREVAARERELKDVWTNACLVTHLAQVMPPPGAILQVPTIGRITLDCSPPRFSVKLRPGQLPVDVVRRADRLAAALRVPAIEVVPFSDEQWISIRLLEPYWIEWPDEYVLEAGDQPPMLESGPDDGITVIEGTPGPAAPATSVTRLGALRRFFGGSRPLPDPDRGPEEIMPTG